MLWHLSPSFCFSCISVCFCLYLFLCVCLNPLPSKIILNVIFGCASLWPTWAWSVTFRKCQSAPLHTPEPGFTVGFYIFLFLSSSLVNLWTGDECTSPVGRDMHKYCRTWCCRRYVRWVQSSNCLAKMLTMPAWQPASLPRPPLGISPLADCLSSGPSVARSFGLSVRLSLGPDFWRTLWLVVRSFYAWTNWLEPLCFRVVP